MNKKLRALCWILGLTAAVGAMFLVGLKIYMDATYFNGYSSSAPLNVEIGQTEEKNGIIYIKLYFDGFKKERVPTLIGLPKDLTGKLPCIIFLHGIGDDKVFMRRNRLDVPFVEAGFVLVCFDQLMRGERKLPKKTSWLRQGKVFRVRSAHTVNDTRRLIDYLITRPDIDPDRIYLCGASYGALTGTTVAALDKRIKAVVLTYGGGDLPRMLTGKGMAEKLGAWRIPAQMVTWYLMSAWDPVKFVGRISPTPLLIQNGRKDTLISEACAHALQKAAKNPEIKWYEGDHLGTTRDLDMPLVTQVLKDALMFIKSVDEKRQEPQVNPK
jgi:dienelactone hydrolase